MTERDDRQAVERETARETRRALTVRERLNRELDALEASLRAMRAINRDLPDDPDPGARVPVDLEGPR